MATTLNFFEIDSETFEDIEIGSVTINGDKITATDDGLLEIVESGGATGEQIIAFYSDFSNGYLRSERES